jgi:hypothetical protein
MKMARASETDLELAQQTARLIEEIEKGYMPQDIGDDDEYFDIDDPEQCQAVMRHLLEINEPGSIGRVTFGMLALLDRNSTLLDPDADTLEPHPSILAMQAKLTRQTRLLREFHEVTIGGFLDDDHLLRLRREAAAMIEDEPVPDTGDIAK